MERTVGARSCAILLFAIGVMEDNGWVHFVVGWTPLRDPPLP